MGNHQTGRAPRSPVATREQGAPCGHSAPLSWPRPIRMRRSRLPLWMMYPTYRIPLSSRISSPFLSLICLRCPVSFLSILRLGSACLRLPTLKRHGDRCARRSFRNGIGRRPDAHPFSFSFGPLSASRGSARFALPVISFVLSFSFFRAARFFGSFAFWS